MTVQPAATTRLALAVLLVFADARPSAAQTSGSTQRSTSGSDIVALVAVPDVFPYRGADAVIHRRGSVRPRDIITVRRARISSALLAEAATTLEAIVARDGSDAPTDLLIRVRDPRPTRRHDTAAKQWLRRLLTSQPTEIPGIGRALTTELVLHEHRVHISATHP